MHYFPLLWNYGPDLVHIGSYSVKWYSLLFALSFVLGRQICIYLYRGEGKDTKYVDTMITYMMIGTTLGARLGHVIFYEWNYYSHHLLEILLPIKFEPTIRFQGFSGLASHGAAIGIILAIFLYTKVHFDIGLKPLRFKAQLKNRPGQSFLWLIDRIVIAVAFGGVLIRMGNFMNSEIYGKPTDSKCSVVFVRGAISRIANSGNFIDKVSVIHDTDVTDLATGIFKPITLEILFKKGATDQEALRIFLERQVKQLLTTGHYITENIYESRRLPLSYSLLQKKDGRYKANVNTIGISRHPSQLYESITCVFVFILLMLIWNRHKQNTREGLLSGLFIIIVFTLRIFHEMLKEGEIIFSNDAITITNAQMLSVPIIILGIVFYFWNLKKTIIPFREL